VCAVFLYPGEEDTDWKMRELLQVKSCYIYCELLFHQDETLFKKQVHAYRIFCIKKRFPNKKVNFTNLKNTHTGL
jgi:hypothetical protein